MAIRRDELEALRAQALASDRVFSVGYNRRYAPLSLRRARCARGNDAVRAWRCTASTPAGVPAGHWTLGPRDRRRPYHRRAVSHARPARLAGSDRRSWHGRRRASRLPLRAPRPRRKSPSACASATPRGDRAPRVAHLLLRRARAICPRSRSRSTQAAAACVSTTSRSSRCTASPRSRHAAAARQGPPRRDRRLPRRDPRPQRVRCSASKRHTAPTISHCASTRPSPARSLREFARMCGITGAYAFGRSRLDVDETVLWRMTDALAHRGPDGRAIHLDPERRVGLGHRRLASSTSPPVTSRWPTTTARSGSSTTARSTTTPRSASASRRRACASRPAATPR